MKSGAVCTGHVGSRRIKLFLTPNVFPLLTSLGELVLVTWNCRALFHHLVRLRFSKRDFLHSLCRGAHIVMLQEVHGHTAALNEFLMDCSRRYHIVINEHSNSDTGTVVTLISRDIVLCEPIAHDVLVQGRLSRIALSIPFVSGSAPFLDGPSASSIVLYNLHHIDFDSSAFGGIKDKILKDIADANRFPGVVTCFLAGDFNTLVDGEFSKCAFRNPASPDFIHAVPRVRTQFWEDVCSNFTELAQTHDTHFCSRSSMFSRLDRIYVSLPSWMLLQMKASGRVIGNPHDLHRRKLSDHAPVAISLSLLERRKSSTKPIGDDILRYPSFVLHLNRLVDFAGFERLCAIDRWEAYKNIVRTAAALTNDDIMHDPECTMVTRAYILTAVA